MKLGSEEILRLFDDETGEEMDESILGGIVHENTKKLERGDAFEKMIKTPGWRLLEDQVFTVIETLKEKILDEKDIEEIRKHQATARAYSNVLGIVRTAIAEAELIRNSNP